MPSLIRVRTWGYSYPGYAQQGAGGGGCWWNQARYGLQLQAGGGCGGYQQGGTQPQQGGFGGDGYDVADGCGGHAALPQGVSRESCPPLHTPTVLPMGLSHGSDLTSAL